MSTSTLKIINVNYTTGSPDPGTLTFSTDTGEDNGPVLVALFYACAQHGGARVFFPGRWDGDSSSAIGPIYIGTTVDLGSGEGGIRRPIIFEGASSGPPNSADGSNGNQTVRFIWNGDSEGTMLKAISHSFVMKNIILDGNGTAGVLYQHYGSGSGRLMLENVVFTNTSSSGVGFKAGVSSNDPNCGDVQAYSCLWNRCGTAFQVLTVQGVNYDLFGCEIGTSTVGVDLQHGGGFRMFGGGVGGCDIMFKTGEGGHNTGVNRLTGLRIERYGRSRKYMQLVYGAASGGGTMLHMDLTMTSGPGGGDDTGDPLFYIRDKVVVHVGSGSILARPGSAQYGDVQGSPSGDAVLMIDENVQLDEDGDQNAFTMNGYGRVSWKHPLLWNAKRLNSFIFPS